MRYAYGGVLTAVNDGALLLLTSGAEVRVVTNDQPFKQFNVEVVTGTSPRLISYDDVVGVGIDMEERAVYKSDQTVYGMTQAEQAAKDRKDHTREFTTGATRDSDADKLDYEGFISPLVSRAFAEYMHRCRTRNVPAGSVLRASDNWQKGIPQDTYAKSLIRHTQEFWLIQDGFEARDEKGQSLSLEDVCCAIMFNVQGFLFEELKTKASRLPGTPDEDSTKQHSPAE
jgi:hypothetical protein